MHKKIGIVGLGNVGLAHALLFSSQRYEVCGVDIDERRLNAIISRLQEDVLTHRDREMLRKALSSGGLKLSRSYEIFRDVDMVFITVNTPTNPDGSQDLAYLRKALEDLAAVWRNSESYRVIVIKSTVLPGTTRRLAKHFEEVSCLKVSQSVGFVHNPEFLRADRALEDLMSPSRIVVGGVDIKSAEYVANLFKQLYEMLGKVPPIYIVSAEEAELVKYASNIFLSLKTVFGNLIGALCENLDNCDARKVLEIVGMDPRIGVSHLKPGKPYGGPCLVKDTRAFAVYAAKVAGIDFFSQLCKYNDWSRRRIVEVLRKNLGSLKGRKIAILGLVYKSGVCEVKDSQSLNLAQDLALEGASIMLHDPCGQAINKTRSTLGDGFIYMEKLEDMANAEAIVIMSDDEEYKQLMPHIIEHEGKEKLLVDVVGLTKGMKDTLRCMLVRLYESNTITN